VLCDIYTKVFQDAGIADCFRYFGDFETSLTQKVYNDNRNSDLFGKENEPLPLRNDQNIE